MIRESTQSKFEEMRDRAKREIRNRDNSINIMGQMGPIKSFAELADSMQKLRENFDVMIGKHQFLMPASPLKKKDLMNEYGCNSNIGGGTLKEQECETDEEESDFKFKTSTTAVTGGGNI